MPNLELKSTAKSNLNEGLRQALMDFLGDCYAEVNGEVTLTPANDRELTFVLQLFRERKGRLHVDARLSRARLAGAPPRGHIGPIDFKSALARASATVRLDFLERALEVRSLTLGPLSPRAWMLDVASYLEGGYAGLRAVPGGRLEPLCVAVTAMMPDGATYQSHPTPRSAAGPDLDAAYLGSGGHLGLILAATLRCFPGPRLTCRPAFSFPDVDSALRAIRGALAEGAWFERVRIAKGDDRASFEATLTGNAEGLDRDTATLTHHVFARGGRTMAPSLEGALPPELSISDESEHVAESVEREAHWDSVRMALRAGAPLVLYRLSLASVIAVGQVDGPRLDEAGAWMLPGVLAEALDPEGILGGAP